MQGRGVRAREQAPRHRPRPQRRTHVLLRVGLRHGQDREGATGREPKLRGHYMVCIRGGGGPWKKARSKGGCVNLINQQLVCIQGGRGSKNPKILLTIFMDAWTLSPNVVIASGHTCVTGQMTSNNMCSTTSFNKLQLLRSNSMCTTLHPTYTILASI